MGIFEKLRQRYDSFAASAKAATPPTFEERLEAFVLENEAVMSARHDPRTEALDAVSKYLAEGGDPSEVLFTTREIDALRRGIEPRKIVAAALGNIGNDGETVAKARLEEALPPHVAEAAASAMGFVPRGPYAKPHAVARAKLRVVEGASFYRKIDLLSREEASDVLDALDAVRDLVSVRKVESDLRRKVEVRADKENLDLPGGPIHEHILETKLIQDAEDRAREADVRSMRRHEGSVGLAPIGDAPAPAPSM